MSPKKVIVEKSLRLDFSTTNNEAEYEALLMGMAMVMSNGSILGNGDIVHLQFRRPYA